MNTLYINRLVYKKIAPSPGKYFVIGVRDNSRCSLESLQEIFPKAQIERLPETPNARYLTYEDGNHILQPAFVTFT